VIVSLERVPEPSTLPVERVKSLIKEYKVYESSEEIFSEISTLLPVS
jgi:hypothetical protein